MIFQVIDLIEFYFRLLNGQFIETRIDAGSRGCQERLINKVIHSHCGYLKNVLTILHLAPADTGSQAYNSVSF